MKWLFLSAFFLLLIPVLQAQHIPTQMIPPPPTAYALGKYGDVPVSLYTGVPAISVPVYALKDHDVVVDISLSYHGSGIKVDEIASFVGLGWSLNAGGVITRVVRGRPETLLSDGSLWPKRSDIQFYDYVNRPRTEDVIHNNQLYAAATGQLDNEPDLFYFNFMGRSGKFVFDKNGQAVLEAKEGLDIKWKYMPGYNLQKFVVTDERGVIYEFADDETTFFPEDGVNRISAWYLSKVTSPTGNTIGFEYHGAATSNQLTRSYSTSWVTVLPYNTAITPPISAPYEGTGFSELRLHRIKTENGEVEFLYKQEKRKDYAILPATNPSSSALEEIRIYKADRNLLKKFRLLTSYFETNRAESYNGLSPEVYSYLNYRLRLDAVQECAADGITCLPPYTFTYLGDNNPSTDDPYTLPYRLSPSQDHWGFYNQAYNKHMIPGLSAARNIPIPSWFKQFSPPDGPESIYTSIEGGANREPHKEAMKAGLLAEMHYPTGGYTAFQFEANDYVNRIPGVRIRKIINYPVAGKPVETDYTYQGYSNYNPADYYFEAYQVAYFYGDLSPGPAVLQQFGVPVEQGLGREIKKYVKVTVQPQAILGHGSEVGYNLVTVSEPGKGSITSIFSSQDRYHDYVDRDYLEEYSAGELNLLDHLFYSEYIDNWYSPGTPYGNVSTRTISSREWPYPEIYSNSWKRGLLTDRYTRTEGDTLLKEEHFDYYHQLLQAIPAFKVIKIDNASYEYVYSKYYVPHTWSKLKSVDTKEYDQNGEHPLTSTTQYYYDNMAHMQPTRIETAGSDGRTEVTDITYPLDYGAGTPFIDDMNKRHLLSYPVEEVNYLRDGTGVKIVSGNITTYKEGGKGWKDQELKLKTASPVLQTQFNFSNRPSWWRPGLRYQAFDPDSRYKSRVSYTGYDAKGNLTGYTLDQDLSTSYLWDRHSQHPVAEIRNALPDECFYSSFEDEGTAGGGHTGTRYHSGPLSLSWEKPNDRTYEISYWYKVGGGWLFSGPKLYAGPAIHIDATAIDDVRIYPADARMTTYTYDPLVGTTSLTDSRNKTVYYEYDGFGRLYTVRDDQGNILKKICYGYAGQTENYSVAKTIFWNTAISTSFKPNNCPLGQASEEVVYSVPAHTYSSVNSQQEADDKARNDVDSNGQDYANQHAVCLSIIKCSDCTEIYQRCINGVCEIGKMILVSSTQLDKNTYECKYYYRWSDGFISETFTLYSRRPCHLIVNKML